MRSQEDGKSEKDEQAPCGRAKGSRGQVAETVLPSGSLLLGPCGGQGCALRPGSEKPSASWTTAVSHVGSSLAAWERTRRDFLPTGRPGDGAERPHPARALRPCWGAAALRSAPRRRRQVRGSAVTPLGPPRSYRPAEVPEGSPVSSGCGLRLRSDTQQGRHENPSAPSPSSCAAHLRPPSPPGRATPGARSFLFGGAVWGLPYLGAIFE